MQRRIVSRDMEGQVTAIAVFGFLLMVILPLLFVASVSIAVLRDSRGWTWVSVLSGILLVMATIYALLEVSDLWPVT